MSGVVVAVVFGFVGSLLLLAFAMMCCMLHAVYPKPENRTPNSEQTRALRPMLVVNADGAVDL